MPTSLYLSAHQPAKRARLQIYLPSIPALLRLIWRLRTTPSLASCLINFFLFRKIQYAPTKPGRQPCTVVRKDFMFSPGMVMSSRANHKRGQANKGTGIRGRPISGIPAYLWKGNRAILCPLCCVFQTDLVVYLCINFKCMHSIFGLPG